MDNVQAVHVFYKFISMILMNKFLDYLILAFYVMFIKVIKQLVNAKRRNYVTDSNANRDDLFDLTGYNPRYG